MPPLPPRGHKARKLAVAILAIFPLLYGGLALLLGQDANWDLRNYHWYNAYAFLNDRYAMDLLPSQTPYFYNPTMDVPFFLLGTYLPAWVATFILASIQGLNFVLLFMLSHTCLIVPNPRNKVLICSLMASIGVLGAGGIAQLGTVFYDNITSLGIFASALVVILNLDALINGKWQKAALISIAAGFPAGLMMGLKLPSVIFCIGLCAALMLTAGPFKRRIAISFLFGIGVLAGIALSLGHWMYFLESNFDSPLFPYFNNFFTSPLAPQTSARDIQFIPQTIGDALLFPYIFAEHPLRVGEIIWRDLRIPVLYSLLPIAIALRLIFGRNVEKHSMISAPYPARYLLWTAVISYAVWLAMFSIYRYAVPLEMLAPLLITFTIGMLPLRITTRGLATLFLMVALVASLQPGNWGRKQAWLAKTVEIDRPEIKDASNLMIIMAGFDPYSHVITEFPPEVSFVRIQSNFSSPDENKGINRLMSERINAHVSKGGKFKLLIPKWQHKMANIALNHFNLTLMPQTCQIVDDHLYDKLDLCDVCVTSSCPER
ncbi:MAG: hypothetical protein PHX43_03475 [Alphaproteobacteria bacterium]|nr:hypothetical protein [Alphaproteobacteria bacterium]